MHTVGSPSLWKKGRCTVIGVTATRVVPLPLQFQLHQPQVKCYGGTGHTPVVHHRAHGGAHHHWRCQRQHWLLSRGKVVTATGVAVHRTWGGGATRGNTSSPFSPPLIPLQMCQHHKCFTITCKCVSIFTSLFQRLVNFHRLCNRPKMQCKYSNT
jgi:hypothetical protein